MSFINNNPFHVQLNIQDVVYNKEVLTAKVIQNKYSTEIVFGGFSTIKTPKDTVPIKVSFSSKTDHIMTRQATLYLHLSSFSCDP